MTSLHPVLRYHNFAEEQFDLGDVTDYTDSVYLRQKYGPVTLHVPTNWQRFGLRLRRADPPLEELGTCKVGYYSAVLDTFKRVLTHRSFLFDSRVIGTTEKFIFLTPLLEHLIQDSAMPAVPLPVSEFYTFGGSRKFRLALECRTHSHLVQKFGSQFNGFQQRAYEEQYLWRVPIAETYMTAVLVKEIPERVF